MRDWLTARPIAHRGLHDADRAIIENTASAFAAAIDANYGIECDLQASADSEAMVYHDETLERLTEGRGRLDALPATMLTRIPFRNTGDRMLTLGDLCDLVAGRTLLLLELKSRFTGDYRLAARTASVLARYAGRVAAMSFDPGMVAALRKYAPSLARGLVAQRRNRRGSAARLPAPFGYARMVLAADLQFVAYRLQDLPAALPLLARHVLGLPLLTWTVRSPEERARAARYADQIIFEGFRP